MRTLFFGVCVFIVGCRGFTPPSEGLPKVPEDVQIARTEALMKQATCRVYSNNRFAGTGSLILGLLERSELQPSIGGSNFTPCRYDVALCSNCQPIRDDIVITAAHLFEGRPISGVVSPTPQSGVHSGSPIEVLFMPSEGHPNADKPFPDIFKGISRTPAALILLNEEIDLAILSISPTGRTALRLANSCAVGQKIMAPSYKHGKELIFPLAEIVNITGEGIIYNASAGGGSSGGPIVNLQGELVGICKGPIEGGLKIMLANYKTIREWLIKLDKDIREIIK
ncbi:MAG: trypsin-like peptidase domain-containing protein [Planctomycetes bacterium]|nr:trypsin-like peptidase domain-containing protein [Planctomycetota bacterium]